MKVLIKYSIANLKRNKKRTIMTIIGVALSCALLLAMTDVAASFHYMIIDSAIAESGNYHQMYEAIPGDKLEIIEQDSNVDSCYYSHLVDNSHFESRTWYIDSMAAYPRDTYDPIYEVPDRLPSSSYNVFVRYKDLDIKTVAATKARILDGLGDDTYNVRENYTLMYAQGYMSENAKLIIQSLALVVYGVVVITSIFIIRNSFSISATERTQQYGVLMSVGARPRQIRRLVYLDAFFISIIAIVAGLTLGALAHFILVQLINALFHPPGAEPARFIFLPLVALSIAGLSAIIVFLSAASPAFLASRQSPISAIRNSKDIKVKDKKYKTSKTAQSFWGIGGVIASKNLKRSRQKYRTTIISIVVSVALFIGLSTFTSYINHLVEIQYPNSDATYYMYDASFKDYDKILSHVAYKQAAYYIRSSGKENADSSIDLRNYDVLITNDAYFQQYAQEIGVKNVDSEHLVILNDMAISHSKYARVTNYKVGDTITLQFDDFIFDEEREIILDVIKYDLPFQIGAITDKIPFGQGTSRAATIIVSDKYVDMQKVVGENRYRANFYTAEAYVDPGGHNTEITNYINELKDGHGSEYEDLMFSDFEAELQLINGIIALFEIFTYGFIIVITLIGVTNIFNTITTNVELRAKEFAILKSVGMTQKEFDRMIRVESLMYSSRALIIGIPIGVLISYGVYRAIFDGGVELGYILPWQAILICVALVGILIWAIMTYSVKQVSKQNIIDTIRNDSI